MFKKNQGARTANPNQFYDQMYNQAWQGMQPGMYPGMQPGMQPGMPQDMMHNMQPSSMYPGMHQDRLQMEIMENRRRINNLTKRIIRLENYLRIRDTSEYANIDENQIPQDFSL